MLPPVVVHILIKVFVNPLSRVVTLELFSRAAINVTRSAITRMSRAQPVVGHGNSGLRIARFPRYRYALYATLIQFGLVTAWSYFIMTPDIFIEDDYIPELPDLPKNRRTGTSTQRVPVFCGPHYTDRNRAQEPKTQAESFWLSFSYPIANVVAFVTAMGMVNGQSVLLRYEQNYGPDSAWVR